MWESGHVVIHGARRYIVAVARPIHPRLDDSSIKAIQQEVRDLASDEDDREEMRRVREQMAELAATSPD